MIDEKSVLLKSSNFVFLTIIFPFITFFLEKPKNVLFIIIGIILVIFIFLSKKYIVTNKSIKVFRCFFLKSEYNWNEFDKLVCNGYYFSKTGFILVFNKKNGKRIYVIGIGTKSIKNIKNIFNHVSELGIDIQIYTPKRNIKYVEFKGYELTHKKSDLGNFWNWF